jgi:hypothetical protein
MQAIEIQEAAKQFVSSFIAAKGWEIKVVTLHGIVFLTGDDQHQLVQTKKALSKHLVATYQDRTFKHAKHKGHRCWWT